jgi:hypothetical protein
VGWPFPRAYKLDGINIGKATIDDGNIITFISPEVDQSDSCIQHLAVNHDVA